MTGTPKSMLLNLLCPLLLAGCAAQAVREFPRAEVIVAEAPTFKVGDEWRYTGGMFVQIAGFDGEYVITVSNRSAFCQGCRWYQDRNGTVVKVLDAQAKPSQLEAIGLKLLDSPSALGRIGARTLTCSKWRAVPFVPTPIASQWRPTRRSG